MTCSLPSGNEAEIKEKGKDCSLQSAGRRMPGCAAVGCNNRSEKGYIMKCFPRDPKLRKIWKERVARADWEPSNNSFLCHVHFEPEEWSIMENGRIRLKKNAVPSIFTITSTRKSAKKRIKLANIKSENECENDTMEYLENDTEYSSTGHLEEKDSDSQDIDNSSIHSFIYRRVNHSPKMIEDKQVSHRQYIDITDNLQQDSIILISDDNNMEIRNNIKESDIEKEKNKQLVGNSITDINLNDNRNEDIVIKTEIKREIDQTSLDDSYDEIEKKLKQICDGYHEENTSNNIENGNSITRSRKETLEHSVTHVPLHRSINYKCSQRNEIGSMLTDNTENIEIIFGSESGEECARLSRCTSYNNNEANEIDKLDRYTDDVDSITNNKKVDKPSPEDIEEAFNRENIHLVTSNMRAAIKRKRRTRKEIMKSIKKSIRNTSSQDTNSASNSDTSDDIVQVENEIEKESNMSESVQFNKDYSAKFIVKVTGDREDVFDIMQDLFKGRDFIIEEHNQSAYQGNNTFITSVITIDDVIDCPEPVKAKEEYNDEISPISITSEGNDQISSQRLSILKSEECTRVRSSYLDENNDSDINSGCLTLDRNTEQSAANRTTTVYNYEYLKLQQKVKMQEDVIKKLTNQLILHKGLERDLQNKNLALELKTQKIESLMNEFNIKTDSTSSSINYKKNINLRQRLIDDLSNRINFLEDTNKKLMKNVTVEYQQKRKLEGQIKQRDNRIKELNWKLEKASKFLERAEKNTNTYRRKMLNMQTSMRRKKLLDEKMSTFDEMLVDNTKEGYSEKALAMAMEIKEVCGADGYNKLLSFGFPLPPLFALRNDNFSDFNESSSDNLRDIRAKHNANKEYDTRCTKSDVVMNTQDQLETSPESASEKVVLDSMEIITGTVQDIFEESNDMDDFSTNELKEQLILQLNTVM